jgi:hypothetical protein
LLTLFLLRFGFVVSAISFRFAQIQDNLGTIKLIDAAKKTGIKKIVMVSSILTNGRNWGQEKSPGFVITNAFGNVLVSLAL